MTIRKQKKLFSKSKPSAFGQASILLLSLLFVSCTPQALNDFNPVKVTEQKNNIVPVPAVQTVTVDSGGITLGGTNLDTIESVAITGQSVNKTLTVLTKDSTSLRAAVTSGTALNIIATKTYNLIISAANAQSIIPITFEILDNAISSAKIQSLAVTSAKLASKAVTYEKIDTSSASNGQVMTYDSATGKWAPKTPSTSTGGGTVSSLSVGTGILFNSGSNSLITTSGSISVDVGSTNGKIPRVDILDGSLALTAGELRLIQEEGGADAKATSRHVLYDKDLPATGTDTSGFDAGEEMFDLSWNFNAATTTFRLVEAFPTVGFVQLEFEPNGAGTGLTVGRNLTVQGDLDVNGADVFATDVTMTGDLSVNDINVVDVFYSGALSSVSDQRLKNIEGKSADVLSEVLKIPVYNFTYKKDAEKKDRRLGVMAQDVKKYFPDAVMSNKEGFFMLKSDHILFTLFKAVQEIEIARAENQSELAKIKAENEMLKNYLCQKDPAATFCQ